MLSDKKRNLFKKLILTLWVVFGLFLISVPILIISVKNGLFGDLPSYKALENPQAQNDLASEIFSADGKILGKYYRFNRTQVTYDEISPEMEAALLHTEDIRFYDHPGIDFRALVRAAKGYLTGDFKGGGSTITMQLAENLYKTMETDENRLLTKLKEYIIAVQLERSFTKEEILTMYLNTVPFGHNSYGISTASKVFFNKKPDSLNYLEASLFVGMLNAQTRFSPIINPENALNKRTEVLYNLHKYGKITKEEFDSLKTQPLNLNYTPQDHIEGPAAYFRQEIREDLNKWAKENGYDLYESGLKIHTTIDSRLQKYAEESVKEHMTYLQELFREHWNGRNPWRYEDGTEVTDFIDKAVKKTPYYRELVNKYGKDSDSIDFRLNEPKPMRVFTWQGDVDTTFSSIDSIKYYKNFLHTGFMAMDPHSGQIRAWVGGIDFRHFQYDHVQQGKRQPGSTFKPIVYTTAIDQGYTPCYMVKDSPVTFHIPGQKPYTPDNYDRKFTNEEMTIRQGLARSKNSITAFLMKKVTPELVVKYARDLGIESDLDAVPSLALGVSDVSIYELIGAYSTFVNNGTYTKPYYITRIEDKYGNVIQEFPAETKEALSEETAYLMIHMLRGATEESGGTALGLTRELRVDNEIGAKTGTTQNASDGWFVGLTKDLVAGVWVGGEERSIHFRTSALGQGARTAMPIWDLFMQKVYRDSSLGYEKGPFPRPTKPLSVEIDCRKYENPNFDPTNTLNENVDVDKLDPNKIQ